MFRDLSLAISVIFLILTLSSVAPQAGQECPRPEFAVAIDIGHTKKTCGGISARGVCEYAFNRRFSTLLYQEFIRRGFSKAFLLNADAHEVSLAWRPETANKRKASLFISIHHDSVQDRYIKSWMYKGKLHFYCDRFKGYSIFYSEKNKRPQKSLEFAFMLGAELRGMGLAPTLHHAEKIKGENRELVDRVRGVYRFDDLVVLKKTAMPAVLFECGLIVNREEELLLTSDGYRRMLASGLVRSVEKFRQRSGLIIKDNRGR